jgi:putative FmdB family regulatory protein
VERREWEWRVIYCEIHETLEERALPLYEYECQRCHRRTEKIETVAGPHLKKCPHCGGKVERMITAPAIQFKGAGWYVTDYARKGAGKKAGAEETSSTEKGEKKESATKESSAKETKESKDSTEKKPAKKK